MAVAPGAKLGVRTVGLLSFVGFSYLAIRVLKVGVVADAMGVEVRLWFRSRRLGWDEIAHFFVDDGDSYLPTDTLHIRTKDGEVIRVQPVSSSQLLPARRSFVHQSAEWLNKLLADFGPDSVA